MRLVDMYRFIYLAHGGRQSPSCCRLPKGSCIPRHYRSVSSARPHTGATLVDVDSTGRIQLTNQTTFPVRRFQFTMDISPLKSRSQLVEKMFAIVQEQQPLPHESLRLAHWSFAGTSEFCRILPVMPPLQFICDISLTGLINSRPQVATHLSPTLWQSLVLAESGELAEANAREVLDRIEPKDDDTWQTWMLDHLPEQDDFFRWPSGQCWPPR